MLRNSKPINQFFTVSWFDSEVKNYLRQEMNIIMVNVSWVLLITLLVSVLYFPGVLHAEETVLSDISSVEELQIKVRALEAMAGEFTNTVDHMWLMVSVMVVFLMNGGFLLYEAGLVRSKNTINTAQKNLTDTLFATIIFYFLGFGLMFGETIDGWIGWSMDIQALKEVDHAFFLYQTVFCSMAATIVSGAMAERIKFSVYIGITAFISCIIYPVFGHWAWGDKIIAGNETFLTSQGFIDFAGATVVCAIGGWVALAGVIVIGPRIGRFNKKGKSTRLQGHSIVLTAFGTIILWMGAMAFNSGLGHAASIELPHILSNTVLAGAVSGFTSLVIGRKLDGLFRPERCVYGILGGLVGVAAGCHVFSTLDTVIIGIISGFVVTFSYRIMIRRFKLDDAVCAVPINGFCGAMGTILVGILATPEELGFRMDISQLDVLLVQVEGVALSFLWAFSIAFMFFKILDSTIKIRVSEEEEQIGLNSAEHGVTIGTGLIQNRLKDIVYGEGDLTKRLDETTGDESAEIAFLFNRFVEKIQYLLLGIKENTRIINDSSQQLSGVSETFVTSFANITDRSNAVLDSSGTISKELDDIAKTINEVSRNVGSISESAEKMSNGVNEISEETNVVASSIQNIADNSANASGVTLKAKEMISNASSTMGRLGEVAENIDSVVDLINDIARKTNRLAFNATVEAARAGEAGKGFSIVADEVRELADQTAKSTNEIRTQISHIQGTTDEAEGLISEVAEIIDNINETMEGITVDVEKQSDSTANISRTVHETAQRAQKIAEDIASVADGTEHVSENTNRAAQESRDVVSNVKRFTYEASENIKSADKVNDSSKDLNLIARDLNEIISDYKIQDHDKD